MIKEKKGKRKRKRDDEINQQQHCILYYYYLLLLRHVRWLFIMLEIKSTLRNWSSKVNLRQNVPLSSRDLPCSSHCNASSTPIVSTPAPFRSLYSRGNNEVEARGHSSRKKSGTRDDWWWQGARFGTQYLPFLPRPSKLEDDSANFHCFDLSLLDSLASKIICFFLSFFSPRTKKKKIFFPNNFPLRFRVFIFPFYFAKIFPIELSLLSLRVFFSYPPSFPFRPNFIFRKSNLKSIVEFAFH